MRRCRCARGLERNHGKGGGKAKGEAEDVSTETQMWVKSGT